MGPLLSFTQEATQLKMANVTVLNTSSNLSGATLVTRENAYTVTGLWTFDRDPSAPFAVSASSAVVTNLDADKVDGIHAAAFPLLAAENVFTAQGVHDFAGSANSFQIVRSTTSSTGTAARALFRTLAGSTTGDLSSFSQGYTTSGINVQASTLLSGDGAGGVGIAATAGPIIFYPAGTTERLRIGSAGLVGTVVSHAGGNDCAIGSAIVVSFTGTPTGVAGGTAGRILYMFNDTGGDLVLSEEDAASSAANRFGAIAGMSIDWRSRGVIQVIYNGNNSRWMVVGTSI